jgi:transcriptional regulator with XRE-family HTH domain
MRQPTPETLRFGDNLRSHRRRIGMSQERLAVLGQMHRTEVGPLESGQREPRLMTIVKLAGVLGVPPATLLAGIGWLVVDEGGVNGWVLIDGRICP